MGASLKTSSSIFSHESDAYKRIREQIGGKYNGAYYYSKEIVENIIPLIDTDRNWVTLNVQGNCYDHSIVFIHSNVQLTKYDWLSTYKDLILVCSNPSTAKLLKGLGKVILLPLSVDVDYVKQFATPKKTKINAYAGNVWKFKRRDLIRTLPNRCDILSGIPREELLPKIAEYENCYAIGRTAIEAKILGCEIKPCDSRYPDPSIWEILDNKAAAKILQQELNKIDKG